MKSGKVLRKFLLICLVVSVTLSAVCTAGARTFNKTSGDFSVQFDDAGAIGREVTQRILDIFSEQYPKMAEMYNPGAPTTVYCRVDPNYDGVAYAYGNNVVFSADWLNNNPNDVDCATHEFFHVVQSYSTRDNIWLIEGMADYARHKFGMYNTESGWSLPNFNSNQKYTDSYRVTARFLVWVEKYVNPDIVIELDDLFRANAYNGEAWNRLTGKSIDDLWTEYAESPDINGVYGDMNGDGAVDVLDVVQLRSAIMDMEWARKYDMNYDGSATVSDVVALRVYIMESNY